MEAVRALWLDGTTSKGELVIRMLNRDQMLTQMALRCVSFTSQEHTGALYPLLRVIRFETLTPICRLPHCHQMVLRILTLAPRAFNLRSPTHPCRLCSYRRRIKAAAPCSIAMAVRVASTCYV